MKLKKLSPYSIGLILIFLILVAFIVNQFLFPLFSKGDTLKIGIVDSGCAESQKNKVEEFRSFTTSDYGFPYDEVSPYDPASINHGTIVCDIIIRNTNNIEIYSTKIADSTGLVTYNALFAAMEYLIEDVNVDIINLSLGGPPYLNNTLLNSFKDFSNEVLIVAAVGNKGSSESFSESRVDWPASLPWVVAVGALNSNGDFAVYSSYGKNVRGIQVTEFADYGSTSSAIGTSFATPRIVTKFVSIWQELELQDPTVNELIYLLAKSTGNSYDPQLGWGLPPNNFGSLSTEEGVLINGYDENDILNRFKFEHWIRTWKFNSYQIDPNNFHITGNGSSFIQNVDIDTNYYGGLLSIEFNASIPGYYEINVGHEEGNSFTYSFDVKNQTNTASILLDHRHSINGYSHEYGEYNELNQFFRSINILPVHINEGLIDLKDFDLVLITEFASKVQNTENEKFYRKFNTTIMDTYKPYIHQGGHVQLFLNSPQNTIKEEYGQFINQLGGNTTDEMIPNESDFPTFISNFTSTPVFDSVDSIIFDGMALEPINSSQSALGWYTKSVFDGVTTTISYPSIGINTTLGNGSIYIWGSSVTLTNQYFNPVGQFFNQYLLNFIDFYLPNSVPE